MIESRREFRIRPIRPTTAPSEEEPPIQEPPPRRGHVLDETQVLTRRAGERPSEERAREEAAARPAGLDAAIDRGETWIEEMENGVAAAGKEVYWREVLGFVGEITEGEPPVRARRPLAPVQHIAEEPPPIRAGTILVPPQEILDEPPPRRLALQERQAPEERLGKLFHEVGRLFSTGEDRKTVTLELIGHIIDLKGKQLRVEQFLGIGGTGAVYKVKDMTDGSVSALKISRVYDHSMVAAKKEGYERLSQSEKDGVNCARRLIQEIAALHYLTRVFDGTRYQPKERQGRQPPFPILRDAQFVHEPHSKAGSKRRTIALEQLEFIEGHTLSAYLRHDHSFQERPPNEAVSYSLQLMEAVQQMHTQGVLHGDIKPNNIVITRDGRLVVIDFDTAFIEKFDEGRDRKGMLGAEHGKVPLTPTYLGPYDLAPIEPRDVFAIGRTLQYMIFGTHIGDLGGFLYQPGKWEKLNQQLLDSIVNLERNLPPQLQVLSSLTREMTVARPEQRPRLQDVIDRLRDELDLPTPQEVAAAEQQAQAASA